VDEAALAQRGGERLLHGGDQALGAVADDQQRAVQSTVFEVGEEVVPGVERLAGAGRQTGEGASCGVSTSGGYTTPTCTPCGRSSARSDSIRPRTANLAGPYAL